MHRDAEQDHVEQTLARARTVLTQTWPFGSVSALRHASGVYPQYAVRAEGSRFWDLAGSEYIDWFLGGGPVTLGHCHPEVQRAVAEQLDCGANLSLPSPLEIDVAERICSVVPDGEQVIFGKNGTDVTSAAVRLARSVTGRDHVLISGYHGFQDWSKAAVSDCRGIPATLRNMVHEFAYNDLDGARRLMEELSCGVAAIVVEPVRHANVQRGFLCGLRDLADAFGAVLVFDEIVTGLRLARGGVQEVYGVTADLTCLAKSIANGLPLSALAGPRRLMRHIPETQFGMTYRRDALALAAARATLDVYLREDVAGHLADIGEHLRSGFAAAAAAAGLDWSLEGHPAMLHMNFPGAGRLTESGAGALFVECCQRAGIYVELHRFLPSLAHTHDDVDRTIEVAANAMRVVRRAMDEGLENYMDGAIWDTHQKPSANAAEMSHSVCSETIPSMFAQAPGNLVLSRMPDGPESRIEVGKDRVTLHIDHVKPGHSVCCTVRLSTVTTCEFQAAAQYRIRRWEPGNAQASIELCGSGEVDGTWISVRHDSSLGQSAWSVSSIGDRYYQQPCCYGTHTGSLRLRHFSGITSTWHDIDCEDEIGRADMISDQPFHIEFRVTVTGDSGPVSVELIDWDVACNERLTQRLKSENHEAAERLVARARACMNDGRAFESQLFAMRALTGFAEGVDSVVDDAFALLDDAWRSLADIARARRGLDALRERYGGDARFLRLQAIVVEAAGETPNDSGPPGE